MKVLLGCDPELFIKHPIDGFINASGIIPGTKKEPFKVDRGAVQVDGMAAEFNIDPAKTEDEFNKNIVTVLAQVEEMVKKFDPDLNLAITSVADFHPDYFALQNFDCKILGCDPDFDGEGRMKVPTEELLHTPVRTAAGHLHIGWRDGGDAMEAEHFQTCRQIANLFKDYPLFTPQTKEDKRRVQYYGGNASFRPKSYGVELRGPSNYWVKAEGTRRRMYRQVVKKLEALQ